MLQIYTFLLQLAEADIWRSKKSKKELIMLIFRGQKFDLDWCKLDQKKNRFFIKDYLDLDHCISLHGFQFGSPPYAMHVFLGGISH